MPSICYLIINWTHISNWNYSRNIYWPDQKCKKTLNFTKQCLPGHPILKGTAFVWILRIVTLPPFQGCALYPSPRKGGVFTRISTAEFIRTIIAELNWLIQNTFCGKPTWRIFKVPNTLLSLSVAEHSKPYFNNH